MMELMILTGVSGAGKATAAKAFEDMEFTVVDNLPPVLLPELVEKCLAAGDQPPAARLAAVIDARSGSFFVGLEPALALVRQRGVRPVILFLDASDAVLVQRFKETRRKHPLFDRHGGILDSLHAERGLLETVREAADRVIDTSDLSAHALRALLADQFGRSRDKNHGLAITVMSFGFKHGLPLDADLVFDVRFLLNPHYVDDLRPLDGRDARVEAYVYKDEGTPVFLDRLFDLMGFSVPRYVQEGKAYLTVAIGCTGGRHRSVMVAEKLGAFLRDQGFHAQILHRDVAK